MSGPSLVLDTNIVQYLLNGDDELEHLLQGTTVFVSVITKIELLSRPGLDTEGEAIVRDLLDQAKVMEFSSVIQERTIVLRRKHRIKLPDAVIAATAAFLNAQLVTADVRFAKLKDDIELLLIER
ncbi:MAG: type II toxin-antitoxin system VapC family toxin [Flavobacteriales bacterium]|nr:type II toxin-antitoxin system VapC family toxin [Flavobacteriales bacterium]